MKKFKVTCRETYLYKYEVTASDYKEATQKAREEYFGPNEYVGVADGNTFESVSFHLDEKDSIH